MWPLKLKYVELSSSSTKINIIYKSYGTTRAATASHQKYRLTPLPSAEKSVFFSGIPPPQLSFILVLFTL